MEASHLTTEHRYGSLGNLNVEGNIQAAIFTSDTL